MSSDIFEPNDDGFLEPIDDDEDEFYDDSEFDD